MELNAQTEPLPQCMSTDANWMINTNGFTAVFLREPSTSWLHHHHH